MSISLRWRLTLWSTFTLAVVMALFLAFASLFLNNISNLFIYPAIDQNLKRLTTANQVQIMRNHSMTRTLQGSEQFGAVLFMVLDRNGNFVTGEQTVPWSAELFDRALAAPGGDGILDTVLMPDRTRVRVFLSPIDMLSPVSGELERQGVLVAATRLDVYDEIVNKAGTYLAGGALVLILIVGAGSFFLTGRALRAVNTVARRARQIESSQDLSQRIPQPRTDDEMGNLVRTFNAMLERLESAFAAQRRFVADSSHELRTPLTVIKGNLHLLRRTDDPAERTELINITEAEISRLNRMVNDLLYMAQMQSGHVAKPILRAVELDSLLLDIFALTRSMAALKDQRVALVHEDIASAYGDRDQLQHLLLNLVDNAVKYTPQGGMISIGMWAEQGWARIEVSDSGPLRKTCRCSLTASSAVLRRASRQVMEQVWGWPSSRVSLRLMVAG